jgi:hypothetical protein
MWLNKVLVGSICSITGHRRYTIISFTKFCRELIGGILDPEHETIGGENIIVEVDEAKFSKKQYNRGHRVDGAWVVGGIERTPEKKVFLAKVKDRKASTLLRVFNSHLEQ